MNPFADRILPDPETRPPVSVLSYNREHLDAIVERVLDGIEHRRNHTQATVVVSSNPGSGKTHLLSRLIDAISARALPVFIPPVNESGSLARPVLNRMVTRLWRMVESGRRVNLFEWLILQLLGLSCPDEEETARAWKEFPVEHIDQPYFQDYLVEKRLDLERYLCRNLDGLVPKPLHESAAVWAAAFLDILSADPAVETMAVEWIKGRVRLYPGLAQADESDAVDPQDEAVRAELRLYDLTQFFGLCRPIVFVFDQVENFPSFGRNALQAFFVLIERLLVSCGATQVVVAVNSADWFEFVDAAGLPASFNDRFHVAKRLRGLLENEARELRDLRVGPQAVETAQRKITDRWIREQLAIGPDGRPQREITPRQFLTKCAELWESGTTGEQLEPPILSATSLDQELAKARAVAEREQAGFYPDSIGTLIEEVLGGQRRVMGGYEFLILDNVGIFIEASAHWRRWEAWASRGIKLDVAAIRAVRPAKDLSEHEHLGHYAVPGGNWRAIPALRRLLEGKLRILEVDLTTMLDVLATCRLLDAAADLGSTRSEIAGWLRTSHGQAWRDFFSAPAGKALSGAVTKSRRPPSSREGIVMVSVSRLLDLLTRPGGKLEPAASLPIRERGLLFHELACRFVQHLLDDGRIDVDLETVVDAFLDREHLWQHTEGYDAEPPRIRDAMAEFAKRIGLLRQGAEGLRSWQELYISTELQVNQVLGVYEGVTIILSGRCDVLRRRTVGGPPEIVDYKLSGARGHAVEKQLQLALYARLLAQGANPLRCDGTLEIYSPGLAEARFGHAELLRFFETEIEPVLRKMARESATRQPPVTRIQIDTLPGRSGAAAELAAVHNHTAAPPAVFGDPALAEIDVAFTGFVGNMEVVGRLKTALAAAFLDGSPSVLSKNILFTGPGGLGKTELARRTARALRLPLIQVPGSRIGKVDDILTLIDSELHAAGLSAREEGVDSGLPRHIYPPLVLFIDEVHELKRKADRFLNLFEPHERRAVGSSRIGDFRTATFIAATTDAGLLPKPFLTRFHQFQLRPYTRSEVAGILLLDGVPGDADFREALGVMSRLNPRTAKLHAEEMMIHHRVHGFPLNASGLERLCAVLGVDRNGLQERDRQYLALLKDGPAGLEILAHALQIGKAEVTRDIEPYLRQLGLIETGRGGRRLTAKGRQQLCGE